MSKTYRVKNWTKNFEGAKSKTYNNKTSCQMPTKHGLGYRRVIKSESGPSIFGAWCATIQILSRHGKPRQGYLTDTGRIPQEGGVPYTSEDLSLLSDIPATIFEKMFDVCSSKNVDWLEVIETTDTTGNHADTMVPLDLDSDLDLNTDSDSDLDPNSMDFSNLISLLEKDATIENAINAVYASHEDFEGVNRMFIENALKTQPEREKWSSAIMGMASKFSGVKMHYPVTHLENWLAGKIEKTEREVYE